MEGKPFECVFKVVANENKISYEILDNEMLYKCIENAAKNKVLLGFLRKMNIMNYLWLEEANYRRFLQGLRLVVRALKNLNVVFIKLRKPVVYVPADIDVLLPRDLVWKAYSRLRNFGFKLDIIEPYTITVRRGDVVVDLYVQPTLGGVIYLDGSRLFDFVKYEDFNDMEIPVLEDYAEALLAIAHSIYKEKIYTLNDYLVVRKWLSRKTLNLAIEMKVLNAVKFVNLINEKVNMYALDLPYRIPIPIWMMLLGEKVFVDKLTRGTLLNLYRATKDLRIGDLIMSKLTRTTY